jgi:hypothetical protein
MIRRYYTELGDCYAGKCLMCLTGCLTETLPRESAFSSEK